MQYTIRKATHDDLPSLLTMVKPLHAESAYRDEPVSTFKISLVAASCIKQGSMFLAVSDKQEIVGFVMGQLTSTWYSTEMILSEIATYITPKHRGGLLAKRLLRAFISDGYARGAVRVELGVSSGINQQRTERFYQKLGGKSVAHLFVF